MWATICNKCWPNACVYIVRFHNKNERIQANLQTSRGLCLSERKRRSGQLILCSSTTSIGDMLGHYRYWQAVVMYWLQVIQMPVTVSLHRRMGGEQHSIFSTTITIIADFTLSRCKLASEWNWTFSSKAALILTRMWGFGMIGLRNGVIVLDS